MASKYEFDWLIKTPVSQAELTEYPVIWDMTELAEEMDTYVEEVRKNFNVYHEILGYSYPAYPNSGARLYARPFWYGRGTTVDNVRIVRDPDPMPQIWTVVARYENGQEFHCYDEMALLNVFGERNVDKTRSQYTIVKFQTQEQARTYAKDYSTYLSIKTNAGFVPSAKRDAECEVCIGVHDESAYDKCGETFLYVERKPYSVRDRLFAIEREENGRWIPPKKSPTTMSSSEHPEEISTRGT